MANRSKQPIQPLYRDEDGIVRFQDNSIVRFLLDWSRQRGMGMNELAKLHFPAQDWQQFAQLIGYSVSGFGDLSYAENDTIAAAEEASAKLENAGNPDPRRLR